MNNNPSEELFISTSVGLRLTQEKQYAFHCEANSAFPIIASTFTAKQICDLNTVPFRRDGKMVVVTTRKNSPFHDIFAIK